MSFFNPEFPLKEKPISQHPWKNIIKDVYSNTYKYGHNSSKNPVYPQKKEKILNINRVKFTIIGDRVVKEFIHSVKLVTGLHKYKKHSFEAPVIRGVTTVEWPKVWNDLKIQYGCLAYCLESPVAVLIGDRFIGGYNELKQLIESKYSYHLTINYYKEGVDQFAKFVKSSGRPFVYMHISVDDKQIGTLIFMLYADIVPLTCANFLRLCKTKKGGYSGTPIHRIVKDCWIQCGGYGLKNNTNLNCENFIVPHDRRGVLCMANNGRNVDCSTQFFVLLQPAPWMAFKYVAFGQLIDGEETLNKIESVPTWYESPTSNITIFKAGILNLECHDIMINRGANAYIEGHIEDLNEIARIFYEELLDRLFLEIEFRMLASLKEPGEEEEANAEEDDGDATKSIRTTKRFIRKKEDLQPQATSQFAKQYIPDTTTVDNKSVFDQTKSVSNRPKSAMSQVKSTVSSAKSENNDFDVDNYQYEPEEYSYQQISAPLSPVVIPRKPFYIPLTDVPYPGEVDSTFDLKKLLRGDYCLESDLEKDAPKKRSRSMMLDFRSEMFDFDEPESEENSELSSIDSDEKREIEAYLENNLDRVSFAGDVIKNIAKTAGHVNLLERAKKSDLLSDETLRRLRVASSDYRHRRDKKVSISVPDTEKQTPSRIKRRQTGFVRAEDLERIQSIHITKYEHVEEEEDSETKFKHAPKVRIAESANEKKERPTPRRPTAFARGTSFDDDRGTSVRPSVLTRLYDEVHCDQDDDEGPTLKDYKPMSETHPKNSMFLTFSQPNMQSDDNMREFKFLRHSFAVEDASFNQVLDIQHGKKIVRKISSDYVKTITQIERRGDSSLRSVDHARTRPTLSVTEYQIKNQKYQEDMKSALSKSGMEPEDRGI